nr:uncharacterized protein LOC117276402 [Nicotiana tomentosiformis]
MTVTSQNSFEILANGKGVDINLQILNNPNMMQQLIPRTISGEEERGSENLANKFDFRRNASENNLAEILKGDSRSLSSSPRLHISSPAVAKIIKEALVSMMLNVNPMIKQPLVTLNTSAQKVPSQIVESFGEHSGGSGQPLLSTGNEKEVIKERSQDLREVINERTCRQEGQVLDRILPRLKTWANQIEFEEEENWENDEDDEFDEFAEQEIEDDLRSVGSPILPNNQISSTLNLKRKLN